MRVAVVAVVLLVALPGRSGAAVLVGLPTNGPSPFGGVFPIGDARPPLISEETTIRVDRDATHTEVEARYRLAGTGEVTEVVLGVPVNGTGDETLSRTIRLSIDGGPEVGCQLEPVGPLEAVPPSASAWCKATLLIPARDGHLLTLRYRGELEYQDGQIARTSHVMQRHLVYPLSSPGYWGGAPARLRVTVDLSEVPGAEITARPDPGRNSGRVLAWTMVGDSPARVRELDVSLTLRWMFGYRDVLLGGARFAESAAASSVLSPASQFAPSHLIDANPLTAWCAGGTGEAWVEVRMPAEDPGEICGVVRVGVVPGPGSAPGRRGARRPAKIRLSACGGARAIVEAPVPQARPEDPSVTDLVTLDLPAHADALSSCLRLTLTPAARGPACLSEVIPFVRCAMPLR
jgi:hypothetical protein